MHDLYSLSTDKLRARRETFFGDPYSPVDPAAATTVLCWGMALLQDRFIQDPIIHSLPAPPQSDAQPVHNEGPAAP